MGLSVPMVVGRGIRREHQLFYQGTTWQVLESDHISVTSGHPYLTPLGLIFWERITSPRGGPFSRVDHPRWDVPPLSQNCRWAPHCVFWWDVPPPQAGPKNLVGCPTSPFCRQDPWHQPKKKFVFLQLFLHCFCPLLVILDALS